MVNSALGLGGLVGVALSGAFMYWQVGRYAAPQVPRTLFDERKEFFAYTAGLFVGIPLAVPLILYFVALQAGGLIAVVASLALLVGGGELAQSLLLRTIYFGTGESSPFYALGIRAGIGGLLSLALVTYVVSTAPGGFGALAFLVAFIQCVAIITVEVAAGLLSVRAPARQSRLGGSPFAGALFGLVGFFLIGYGTLLDPGEAIAAAALAAVGGAWVFFRLRDPVLAGLLPPRSADDDDAPEKTSPYGRITP